MASIGIGLVPGFVELDEFLDRIDGLGSRLPMHLTSTFESLQE